MYIRKERTHKKLSEMTPEELKAYKHERYKTNNFEITLRLTELTKEQQAAIVSALSSFKVGE